MRKEKSVGMADSGSDADIVVVGSGIAGLTAAVTAAEELAEQGRGGRVVVVERAPELEAGGNTRWTSAYFRLDDIYDPGPDFASDLAAFSDGRTPAAYVERLIEELPGAMEWIQGQGIRFRRLPTYFINSSRERLQPVGGGEGLIRCLRETARRLGVEIRYGTTAVDLTVTDGYVRGIGLEHDGRKTTMAVGGVVIASGGFEGDPARLGDAVGGDVETLVPIAPGVAFNRGEGIDMALRAGAARSGEWSGFHAEPVDPRARNPEALVMVYPYGILVSKLGRRFLDEGAGTVDETYESVSRAIWRQPGGTAYFVTDQQFSQVTARSRGILTDRQPVTAATIAELATALGIPAGELGRTVDTFNAAVGDGTFNWRKRDGKSTHGLTPRKSNWALRIEEPPFIAYPVSCAIVFTYGGLAVDEQARVLDQQGGPIGGLYAVGECTGIYYGKYAGGTSVMRGLVFGRVAGRQAVRGHQTEAPMTGQDQGAVLSPPEASER